MEGVTEVSFDVATVPDVEVAGVVEDEEAGVTVEVGTAESSLWSALERSGKTRDLASSMRKF